MKTTLVELAKVIRMSRKLGIDFKKTHSFLVCLLTHKFRYDNKIVDKGKQKVI